MNAANFDELSDEEKEHFYRCSKCGEFVDKRELRDVIFHETDHSPPSPSPSENQREIDSEASLTLLGSPGPG
jgi:hypothetical protein